MTDTFTIGRRGLGAGLLGLAALPRIGNAADPVKFNLAMSSQTMTPAYPYLYVADQLGYWKEEGLDVNIVLTQGSGQVIQLLAAGQVQAGVINPEPVIVARVKQKQTIRSIASIGTIFSWAVGTLPDSPIQNFADLKGKKLGVVSLASGGVLYVKARAEEAGLNPEKDFATIAVGFGATAAQALQSRQVDAILLWRGAFVGIENMGVKLRYVPPAPWEANLYSFIVASTDQVIAQQGDAVAKMLRGLAKASEFTMVNPKAAAQAYRQRYPDAINTRIDARVAFENDTRQILGQLHDMGMDLADVPKPPARIWGGQSERNWSFLQDYLKRTGQLDEAGDPSSYFTDQFTKAANEFDRGPIDAAARNYKTEF